jgi:hypothetical protein
MLFRPSRNSPRLEPRTRQRGEALCRHHPLQVAGKSISMVMKTCTEDRKVRQVPFATFAAFCSNPLFRPHVRRGAESAPYPVQVHRGDAEAAEFENVVSGFCSAFSLPLPPPTEHPTPSWLPEALLREGKQEKPLLSGDQLSWGLAQQRFALPVAHTPGRDETATVPFSPGVSYWKRKIVPFTNGSAAATTVTSISSRSLAIPSEAMTST